MHSALRPYMTTGLAIVGSSVLAFAPIAPPAPAESATTTTQSAQQVTLKAKVITINPSPDAVARFASEGFASERDRRSLSLWLTSVPFPVPFYPHFFNSSHTASCYFCISSPYSFI